jgi:hypothetical protein
VIIYGGFDKTKTVAEDVQPSYQLNEDGLQTTETFTSKPTMAASTAHPVGPSLSFSYTRYFHRPINGCTDSNIWDECCTSGTSEQCCL